MGAFFGRALRGDWAGSLQAALWPLALLLVTAVACAIPEYGQGDEEAVGFTKRLRLAFATVLHAVGGELELSGREERGFTGATTEAAIDGTMSLHLVPLTVTALFIGALFIGARVLRNRLRFRAATYGGHHAGPTAGLEAALRVGLLTAAGVLVLGLFAQPEIEGVEVSSGPFLATLGALVLALAVSGSVLHRDGLAHWLAVRPGTQAFLRAAGVALRALTVVLILASAVGYLTLTQIDDLSDAADTDDAGVSPYVVALFVLPNLGLAALGVGWGAPLEAEVTRRRTSYGGDRESPSFGLSELGDLFNTGAVVGALALGLVCALTIGVLAARRCAGRGEQVLAGGLFFAMFLLLVAVGGFSVETRASEVGFGGNSAKATVEGGVSVPDALLFGLLWVAGGVLVGPFVARMAGPRGGVGGPPPPPGPPASGGTPGWSGAPGPGGVPGPGVVPAPGGAPAPGGPPGPGGGGGPAPGPHTAPTQSALPLQPSPRPGTPPGVPGPGAAPTAHDPHTYRLGHPGAPQHPHGGSRGRAGIWATTLVGALVIGGAVAAGVLLWQGNDDDKAEAEGKNGGPSVTHSERQSAGSSAGTGSDAPTESVTQPAPTGSPSSDTRGTGGATGGGLSGGTDEGPTAGTGSASGTGVPAGSRRVTDTMGFSFAVPDGWSRAIGDNPTQIVYASPSGPENFQVGVIEDADYTSYGNLRNMEEHAKKDPDKSDYRRLRLVDTTFKGRPAAVWEYTYEDRAGRTIHAIDHSYIAENGTEYAVQLSWRDDFWPAGRGARTHRAALDTWRLTG